MRKRFLLSFTLCCLLIGPEPLFSAGVADLGTSGVSILKQSASGRTQGMGNAFNAVSDDVHTLYGNPAGMGGVQFMEFITSNREMIENIRLSQAGTVIPLSDATSSNVRDMGVIGASVHFLDYGRLQGRDINGNEIPSIKAEDQLWSLSYGRKVNSNLMIGARGHYYTLVIADKEDDGLTVDVGVIYQSPSHLWSIGYAGKNLVGDSRFDQQTDPVPETHVGGITFHPIWDRLQLTADIEDPKYDSTSLRTGGELWVSDILAVRAGYDSNSDLGGLTFGLGFQILHLEATYFPIRRLAFDYAFLSASGLSDEGSDSIRGTHQFSVSIQFGEEGHVSR